MSVSRVSTTWLWGGWPDASAWPLPMCPSGRLLRQITGEIYAATGDRSQYTYVSCHFPPQKGFSPDYSVRTTLCPYLPLPCRVFSQSPVPKVLGSASRPSDPIILLSLTVCWVGLIWPAVPSHPARINMVWWGGCYAHGWAWGPFWSGWRPCHVACCYEKLRGHPSWNIGHAIYWSWPHSRHSGGSVMEFRCRIRGIWHLSIPGPRAPFRSPWTAQRRVTPLSSFCGICGRFPSIKFPPIHHRESLPSPVFSGYLYPPLLLVSSFVWSPEQNSTQPCRAVKSCPVTMHGVVQFPFTIRVGSSI